MNSRIHSASFTVADQEEELDYYYRALGWTKATNLAALWSEGDLVLRSRWE